VSSLWVFLVTPSPSQCFSHLPHTGGTCAGVFPHPYNKSFREKGTPSPQGNLQGWPLSNIFYYLNQTPILLLLVLQIGFCGYLCLGWPWTWILLPLPTKQLELRHVPQRNNVKTLWTSDVYFMEPDNVFLRGDVIWWITLRGEIIGKKVLEILAEAKKCFI
jgi:hypothetical protein